MLSTYLVPLAIVVLCACAAIAIDILLRRIGRRNAVCQPPRSEGRLTPAERAAWDDLVSRFHGQATPPA